MTPMESNWVTTTEAMAILEVSRPTVLALIRSGELTARQRGRRGFEVREADVRGRLEPVRMNGVAS